MKDVQKTALKETAKTLAGLTAVALAVPAIIFLVPLQVISSVLLIGALGYAVKMIYDVKLSQAEFEASRKEQ
jgi:hypothetical protein